MIDESFQVGFAVRGSEQKCLVFCEHEESRRLMRHKQVKIPTLL